MAGQRYSIANPYGANPSNPNTAAISGGITNLATAFFGDPKSDPTEEAKNVATTNKTNLEATALKDKQHAASTFYDSVMALPADQRKNAIAGAAMHYADQTGDVEGAGKIAQLWAGLTDQPDAVRANTHVAAGGSLKPDESFSLPGQDIMRANQVKDKIAVSTGEEKAKVAAAGPNTAASMQNASDNLDRLAASATELMNHRGLPRITGVMGDIPNIPGGAAANAAAKLDNLKSQAAFNVLQNMRENSKTGGALGNVSNEEEKLLTDNLASLDTKQSTGEFQNQLQKIVDYATNAKSRLSQAYNAQYGAPPAAATAAAPGAAAFNAPTAPPGMAAPAAAPAMPAAAAPAAPQLPAGVTNEDIAFTAQKYKMTPEQVLNHLSTGGQ